MAEMKERSKPTHTIDDEDADAEAGDRGDRVGCTIHMFVFGGARGRGRCWNSFAGGALLLMSRRWKVDPRTHRDLEMGAAAALLTFAFFLFGRNHSCRWHNLLRRRILSVLGAG